MQHFDYWLRDDEVSPDGKTSMKDWFMAYKYRVEGEVWVPLPSEPKTVEVGVGDTIWFILDTHGAGVAFWKAKALRVMGDPMNDRTELWFDGESPTLPVFIGTRPHTVTFGPSPVGEPALRLQGRGV